MKRDLIGEFREMASSNQWLKSGKDAVGMVYDLDGAILNVLRIKDNQFSIEYDEDGDIMVTINYPFPIRYLGDLESKLYRIWARVAFWYSLIHREYRADAIVYRFMTGTKNLGYRGTIIFQGERVQQFLSELKRRQQEGEDGLP